MDTFVELKAIITDFQAKMAAARGEMDATEKKGGSSLSSFSGGAGKLLAGIGAVGIGVAVVSVKMAADFQSSMTALVTGAGESQKNLKMVSNGILALAPATGTTTKQLAAGMYMIESAGFHGASGLLVLKAAAEGAKIGSADLGTVADAVTTALTDYHLPAQQAATVTSQLVATVASGKTHMQDLAGALATVLPGASAAGLGLNEVLGAMATMTAKGTPAADAATYLKQTIMQLSNPTAKAAAEMKNLGIDSTYLSSNLGENGLTGTLAQITDAIQSHMGPAGTVLIESLKKASTNTTAFQKILANLPPTQQTYIGALADMVGGTKSMQAALELTGSSAATFDSNVKNIGATTATASGNVQGWSIVQQDFNQKMSEAKARVEVLGIELGTRLIPVFEKVVQVSMQVVNWLTKHKQVATDLAITLGVLVVALGAVAVAGFIVENVLTLGIAGAIAGLIVGITLLVTHWKQVWGDVLTFVHKWGVEIAAALVLLSGFILLPIAALLLLYTHWKQTWDLAKSVFNTFVAAVAGIFNTLYNNTIGAMIRLATGAWKEATYLVFVVLNEIGQLPGQLLTIGRNMLEWLLKGAQSAMGDVKSFFVQAGKDILNFLGAPFGIHFSEPSMSPVLFKTGAQMMKSFAAGIKANAHLPTSAVGAMHTAMAAGIGAVAGGASGNFALYQQMGQAMAAAAGWTGAQWTALNNLVMAESGWNPTAQNPTSSAYGIAQNIGGAAGYPNPSAVGQIQWMLAYIKSRYGSPAGAWAHEMAYHWYDQGGLLPPGLSLALNTTGSAEVVRPGGAAGAATGGGDLVVYLFPSGPAFARVAGPELRKWLVGTVGKNSTRTLIH